MRRSHFGVLLGTMLILGNMVGQGSSEPALVGQGPVSPYTSVQTGTVATHVLPADGGPPTVVVVDTSQRVMAVYHIDRSTGEIGLRSVRNLTWDLEMLDYNSGEPLPQDIRNMQSELQR